MKKKKDRRGGPGRGQGRKPSGGEPRVPVSSRIRASTRRSIAREADLRQVPAARVVEDAIEVRFGCEHIVTDAHGQRWRLIGPGLFEPLL